MDSDGYPELKDMYPQPELTYDDKWRIGVAIDHYLADLRKACEEDQGKPEGYVGTIGNSLIKEFEETKEKFNTN